MQPLSFSQPAVKKQTTAIQPSHFCPVKIFVSRSTIAVQKTFLSRSAIRPLLIRSKKFVSRLAVRHHPIKKISSAAQRIINERIPNGYPFKNGQLLGTFWREVTCALSLDSNTCASLQENRADTTFT